MSVWLDQRLLDSNATPGSVGDDAIGRAARYGKEEATVSKRFDKSFRVTSSQVQSHIDIPSG